MEKQTILLVEDEFIIRFALGEALREAGYNVVEAEDGAEGLAVLLSAQSVELLVTDVRMPGEIDGIELSRRSKAIKASRPVVVCSGHLRPSDADPADAFLAKPYPAERLVELVQRLIGRASLDDARIETG